MASGFGPFYQPQFQSVPNQPPIIPGPQVAPQFIPSILPTTSQVVPPPVPSVSLAPQEEEILIPTESQQAAGVVRRELQTRVPPAETNLSELTYSELDLMPMRCYGCGEVIRQIAIEDSLRSGRSLKETLDLLDYPLLCCRDLIRGQVSVLEIEKRRAAEERIQETPLTITSTAQPSTFSLGPGKSVSALRVIDESPPETELGPSYEGGFGPIIGSEESFLQDDAGPGDAYQYLMMQLQGDLEEEED